LCKCKLPFAGSVVRQEEACKSCTVLPHLRLLCPPAPSTHKHLLVSLSPPCASSGLRVATHWSPQPDMLLTTARLYDADGRLLEVITSTAIRHEDA